MIQLSNLLSMNPETPAKTVGLGDAASGFADVLAGELESDPVAGGKILPGALPVDGKSLPVGLPVAGLTEMPGELPVALPVQPPVEAQAASVAEDTAAKAPAIGPIVIPSIRLAAANREPLMADQGDAEPKSAAPRAEALPLVAAKAVAAELKARVRPDRPVADETADKPVDPEASDMGEVETEVEADAPTVRPAIAIEVLVDMPAPLLAVAPEQVEPIAVNVPASEEKPAPEQPAELARPETKRGDARMPVSVQTAAAEQAGEARETIAAKDSAGQKTDRDTSGQDEGKRGQRSAPELRFELSRAVSDTRFDRAAIASANQIRMPLAAASQIVLPEAATISGQVADASGLPGAANTASTSFASQQGVRPHDFTMLVDRLVEARETARGGSVNVAVMHADFGEVSLRFRQDAGGLSVSMSNSDPEFARAVSAASQADGAQMGDNSGQGGRRDDSTQNGSTFSRTGTSSEWGQSSGDANLNGGGRQNMQDETRGDQIAAQARGPADEDRAGRDGIYA